MEGSGWACSICCLSWKSAKMAAVQQNARVLHLVILAPVLLYLLMGLWAETWTNQLAYEERAEQWLTARIWKISGRNIEQHRERRVGKGVFIKLCGKSIWKYHLYMYIYTMCIYVCIYTYMYVYTHIVYRPCAKSGGGNDRARGIRDASSSGRSEFCHSSHLWWMTAFRRRPKPLKQVGLVMKGRQENHVSAPGYRLKCLRLAQVYLYLYSVLPASGLRADHST